MKQLRILVTGATGAIGSSLIPSLITQGHHVAALSRRTWTEPFYGVTAYQGDIVKGEGIDAALADVDIAYYLIHSMEQQGTNFSRLELQAAENFAAAAKRSGTKRIIYLGGLIPKHGHLSKHLASRLAVERVLLAAVPDSVAFRASIVIDAHSRSFRFLVRLIERLPLLTLPSWRNNRTQPIDGRDVTKFLLDAATAEGIGGRSLDLVGPDTVTYKELLNRIAEAMLLKRPTAELPFAMTPLASVVAAKVAGEDSGLIEPLMESLETDLIGSGTAADNLLNVKLHTLDAAIDHALYTMERSEPLAAS